MVGFTLNEEHEALRSTVEEFAREVVAPVIGQHYERGEFPYEIVARMGKLGLFGLPFPEEYGGMGGDYLAFCLALHELARVDSSVAITLEAGVALGAMPIYRCGTPAQKERWLPGLCLGERLAAFGLTEPGGGSDIPGGMRTTARLDGDEWVIDGSKAFITNSGTSITSVVTALAITGRTDGKPEISAIMVPSGTAGFTVGPEYSKVGWCCSDTRELAFSGCRVPAANLLGQRGRPVPADARRGPGGDRGAVGRAGAGLRRRVPAVCRRADGVRPRARPLPGDAVPDRGHGGQGTRGPAGLA
jgi:alkylation response protein AidB-like acyl-CoA dehydrogenase